MSTKNLFALGNPKSYVNYENAEKQFAKLPDTDAGRELTFRTCVVAVREGSTTRFVPMVVLNKDQQWMGGFITRLNITVTF